jgi:signal transduction histidine kinase
MTVLRQFVGRHWPRLHLRTILLATLIFVALLPGAGAVFLRVYENTLVRQTEAELVAQGAALTAAAEALWPGAVAPPTPEGFRPEPPRIDLNVTPILDERPAPRPGQGAPSPGAVAAAEQMLPILAETRRTTLASIQVLDAHGRILTGPETGGSYAFVPEVAAALAGRTETALRRNGAYHPVYSFEWLSRAADIRIHHARPIIVNGKVVGVLLLSRSARALFRGIYQDGGKIAIGVGAVFATLIVLATLVARGIARPIERLSSATRELALGRGDPPPVPATAAIEIQALYRDFAAMARAIESRSRYMRDFAYAVSHEFKTPLAGIAGAVELLQDHAATMSEAERRTFLTNIDCDAARLTQLLTGVLDLARADMRAGGAVEGVDPRTPLLKIADAYNSEGMQVTVSMTAVLAPVRLPAQAIETCLSNLLENSRRAGATRVEIRAGQNADSVVMDLCDNGPGITEGDRDRIFEPFFTTRRDSGGTGLGLAIVRSLLQAHNGEISLLPSQEGTHFRLVFPLFRLGNV